MVGANYLLHMQWQQPNMLNCIFVFIFVQGSSQWEMLLLIVFCLTFFITCV
jgi:hypothetical protein